MNDLALNISHLLAGSLVLLSFMMLYQDRMFALINIFTLHAVALVLSVIWQAYIQDQAALYVTAAIAFSVKAIVIPLCGHNARCMFGAEITLPVLFPKD